MRLLEAAPVIAHAACEGRCIDGRDLTFLQVAKQPLAKLEKRFRLDLAAGGEDQARRNELIAQPSDAIGASYGTDTSLRPDHWSPDRLPFERGFEQMIVDEVVRRIRHFAKLGQDHLLL